MRGQGSRGSGARDKAGGGGVCPDGGGPYIGRGGWRTAGWVGREDRVLRDVDGAMGVEGGAGSWRPRAPCVTLVVLSWGLCREAVWLATVAVLRAVYEQAAGVGVVPRAGGPRAQGHATVRSGAIACCWGVGCPACCIFGGAVRVVAAWPPVAFSRTARNRTGLDVIWSQGRWMCLLLLALRNAEVLTVCVVGCGADITKRVSRQNFRDAKRQHR